MALLSVLQMAHTLVSGHARSGCTLIDATVGNGFDTLFLMEQAGPGGHVFGFDIQSAALDITMEKIAQKPRPAYETAQNVEQRTQVQLFKQSHADMRQFIPLEFHGQVSAIMFNLGYCPGQDHSIVTRPSTTTAALSASVELLGKGGIITIVAYTGHPGASEEAAAVLDWSSRLPYAAFDVFKYDFINQISHPSFLVAVGKK